MVKICKIDSCDNAISSKDLCSKHYTRLRRNGTTKLGIVAHRLSEIDEENRHGTCSICGRVKLYRKRRGDRITWKCIIKYYSYLQGKPNIYGKFKHKKFRKDVCEKCGFIPVHYCQLDVHHVDNNHSNNSLDNLQTLCANCHRLETQKGREFDPEKYKIKK